MKTWWIRLFVVALSIGATWSAAQAAENVALGKDGGMYGRLGLGYLQINDVDFSSSSSAYGISVSANGSYSFDAGVSVSGAVGTHLTQYLRGEVELGYAAADYDKLSGALTVTSGGSTYSVTGSADIDGSVTMLTGLANLVYDLGSSKTFKPYVGGGLGFVNVEDKISSIGTLQINGSETRTKLAGDLQLGFESEISDGVKAGVQYRYFWADTGQNGVEDATAHNLMATISATF